MSDTFKKTINILKKYNIKANKRFGQNFLIDDYILKNIIDVSNITTDDLVIEIGPGLGNLTEYILDVASYALLVEIDDNMISILDDRFKDKTNYNLINEDILKTNIDEIIEKIEKENKIKYENVKVVANLPYYITTPIIFKLLQDSKRISTITVMVQKEVAERIIAKPKSKDYGILTIMVDYFSNAKIEFLVPPNSFIPEPGVTSAILKLEKCKKYSVGDENKFFELVHKAFAQRRKKVSNSLESNKFNNMNKESIEMILKKCDISETARAEELSILQYIELINKLV
jgi:16S rRNA (adenine1518-N6/adenine1519-N6)-dimethyltransferase